MEEGENILGAIYEDDNLEDLEDIEMLDVEEGELLEHDSSTQTNLEQSHGGDANVGNVELQSKNRRRRANKKKNKKKRSGLGPKFTDINRFVSDTCKHLKERKSYMVYTAVGCLGVSALSDLIKEVYHVPLILCVLDSQIYDACSLRWRSGCAEICLQSSCVMDIVAFLLDTTFLFPDLFASLTIYWYLLCDQKRLWSLKPVDAIQACGGQMTADGRRSRTGGGILWGIIRARSPGTYKEIMKKTKEFEKQFKQQNNRQAVEQTKEDSSQRADFALTNEISPSIPDDSEIVPQNQPKQSSVEGKHKSVRERIRVPVSYDDLLVEDSRTESL
ncbi:hypothetical protein Patl1_12994 [Pistacia atlantica]|uniref:Uncharacterized protein n=1 Tax=Pistacia atlantica TaxID=434234 RepID=A0ACC1AV78_9ROSI|nr:hypothetical protein Patl1_12994 [Pistacia atlantica]